jgi:arylsulfatase A-like enzyme
LQKLNETSSIYRHIRQGAILGSTGWLVYGAVECIFSSILPWIIRPGYEYVPLHWGLTCLLFLIYPVIGFVLGGFLGFVLAISITRIPFFKNKSIDLLLFIMVPLSIILAYIINLINNVELFGLAELPPLSISAPLIFAVVLSAGSPVWFNRLRFLTNPWTVCVLLLGLPWINRELFGNFSFIVKAGAAFAYPAIILAISFFLQKFARHWRLGRRAKSAPTVSAKSLLTHAAIVLVVLGITLFLKQEPIVVAQNSSPSTTDPSLPNVILIVMDTVRADHMSLYGYERDTTPNLLRLAQQATVYTRAMSSSDMTLATHASLFTGMYAKTHAAHYAPPGHPHGRPLAQKFRTLAEILSENGYLTAAVVANHAYLAPYFALHQGFHLYDNRAPVPFLGQTEYYFLRQSLRNALTHFAVPAVFDQQYRRAEDINREALAFLDEVKEKGNHEPFFLFLNYMDAHEPYIPPPPFDTLYDRKDQDFTLTEYFRMQKQVMKGERKVTEEEYHHYRSQYDGGIAYIDHHLGKLIERLQDLSLYDNALLVITSDHGEVFGERGLIGHASSVYQDQVHVPLFVKFPNTNRPRVVEEMVSLVDLMPTILDTSGFEIPSKVEGKSLLDIKSGNQSFVLTESYPNGTFAAWHPRFDRIERAIFSGSLKLIKSTTGKYELYDLSADPHEKANHYKPDDPLSKELETKLDQWIQEIGESSTSTGKLDKEAIERLKSLGYVK